MLDAAAYRLYAPQMKFPDTKMFLHAGTQPAALTVLAFALAGYFAYHATRFRLANVWPLAPIGDASILFEEGRRVFALGDYPGRIETWRTNGVFPYPPSAVLIFRWLGAAGPGLFMGAWITGMAAGLVTTLRASLAAERPDIRAAWLLIGALALVVADGPVSWDLRNANSNLVCLGAIMGGYALMDRHPMLAGALLALSIGLKPYGALLLPWLLLCGPRRTVLAGFGTLILLTVAWPVLTWGAGGAVRIYLGWLEQLKIVADPQVQVAVAAGGPPVVSLGRAAMALTGEDPLSPAARAVVGAVWTIWIAAIVWYAWRAARSYPLAIPSRAALADWTVLLLAPLPFSPWLEPYHAVPIVPGAILLVLVALDDGVLASDRRTAVAALMALGLTRTAELPFAMRGMVILVQFLAITVGLGLLRPRLSAITAKEAEAPVRPQR
jgi:Glycosyltransferase family 87